MEILRTGVGDFFFLGGRIGSVVRTEETEAARRVVTRAAAGREAERRTGALRVVEEVTGFVAVGLVGEVLGVVFVAAGLVEEEVLGMIFTVGFVGEAELRTVTELGSEVVTVFFWTEAGFFGEEVATGILVVVEREACALGFRGTKSISFRLGLDTICYLDYV